MHVFIVLPGPEGIYRWIRSIYALYRWIRSLRLEVGSCCCELPEHSRYPKNIWWTDGQVNGMDGWMSLKNVSFSAEQTGNELTSVKFPEGGCPLTCKPSRQQTPWPVAPGNDPALRKHRMWRFHALL